MPVAMILTGWERFVQCEMGVRENSMRRIVIGRHIVRGIDEGVLMVFHSPVQPGAGRVDVGAVGD